MLADGKEIVAKSLISVGAGTSGPQRAISEVLEHLRLGFLVRLLLQFLFFFFFFFFLFQFFFFLFFFFRFLFFLFQFLFFLFFLFRFLFPHFSPRITVQSSSFRMVRSS